MVEIDFRFDMMHIIRVVLKNVSKIHSENTQTCVII